MSVLPRLANALGRNDEAPNVALAESLAASGDEAGIAELVGAIGSGPQAVRNDAIKALYELGERRPELLAPHWQPLFTALKSRNNRMVWGALTAIDTITAERSADIAARLPEVLEAAAGSSVIARDRTVSILVKLAEAGHQARTLPILLDTLRTAPDNQLPSYAEAVGPLIGRDNIEEFRAILETRLRGMEQKSKRVRIEKVLRRLPR